MLSIRQIHPVFVGEVSGIDLRKPLTREEAAAIDAGMDRYAVLVFRDQNITDDQQMAFTKNFGEIENAKGGNITKAHEYRLKQGMVDVSNLDKDGKPLPRDDRRRMFNLGNRLWHSDSSFRAKPAKYSDRNITDDQQMAFTKNFGEIENAKGGNITKAHEYRLKQGMVDVSNLDKDGKPLPRDDRRRMFNLGNRLWHSDSSFRAKPAKY